MSRNSGLTMIELLVVVAIVGILIAVAVPSMRSFSEQFKLFRPTVHFLGRTTLRQGRLAVENTG